MVRHFVTFTLEGFDSPTAAQSHLQKIKVALEALPARIHALKAMRVYPNENPAEAVGFILEADLDTWQDLPLYAEHPEHQSVVKELIAPYKKGRACVDFEV